MNGRYLSVQKGFLTGRNRKEIRETAILKYTGGFFAAAR